MPTTRSARPNNYYTFAQDYTGASNRRTTGGAWTSRSTRGWPNGLTFQGGTRTGSGVRDNCDVIAASCPSCSTSLGVQQQATSCAVTEPFLTTFRGLVAYTIPKIDVSLSSSFRSQANIQPDAGGIQVATNGVSLNANTNIPAANVPGGLALARRSRPSTWFFRVRSTEIASTRWTSAFGKILRFGRTRTNVALDLYNLFNSNTGTAYQQGYDFASNGAAYRRPTTVLNPRFVRFNVTVDF